MNRDGLLAAFSSFPSRLASAAATAGPPPPGEWGPLEVTRHLIAVDQDVHAARLRDVATSVATSVAPAWSWVEPGPWPGEPDATLDQLVGRFAAGRAALVATFLALDEEGWARFGTHATFGRLDVAGLLRVAVRHDEEHLAGLRSSDREA